MLNVPATLCINELLSKAVNLSQEDDILTRALPLSLAGDRAIAAISFTQTSQLNTQKQQEPVSPLTTNTLPTTEMVSKPAPSWSWPPPSHCIPPAISPTEQSKSQPKKLRVHHQRSRSTSDYVLVDKDGNRSIGGFVLPSGPYVVAKKGHRKYGNVRASS